MSTDTNTIGGRYAILHELGSGSQGETFVAQAADGDRVVLKKFTLAQMAGWKSLELFEREIATLRMLDHPKIPKFIDAVEEADAHYLVQEFIEGEPLSDLVKKRPFDEDELRAVARDVLEVLTYMHELVPPVVHRDLKPSNIIRRPDGTHVVVDFGGVQNIVAKDTGGSTVVGTSGYMPSEQLIGRAVPQSDLYALGATLAHLATAKHPSELPTKRLVIEWRPTATLRGELADAIDDMLSPAPEDRPDSARTVQERLSDRVVALTRTAPSTQLQAPAELVSPRDASLHLARRLRPGDHTIIVDLSPDTYRSAFWTITIVALIGFAMALYTGETLAFVVAVGIVGLVGVLVGGIPAVSERLRLFDDGRYEYRWSNGKQRRRASGRITAAPVAREQHLEIATDTGLLQAADDLEPSERRWIAAQVATWFGERTQSVPGAPALPSE